MSTTARALGEDQWLQVPATWGAYVRLLRAKGEKSSPKYVYCDGRLTIVSPGFAHESYKHRTSGLIELALTLLGVPFRSSGAMTLKQGKPKKKGVEGDTSYYLTNLHRIRGKKTLKMGVDPPPDLQVEIVVSHPVDDALKAHAAFGVREVWVIEGSELTFLVLSPGGEYEAVPVSHCLPFFSSEELAPWVFREGEDESAVRREFMNWVMTTLVPRFRPEDGRAGG
jgi:Uma2 family endonuclease